MSNSSTASPTIPHTVWLARGRHVGSDDPAEVVRRQLQRLKDREVIDDHLEPDANDDPAVPELVFEARWRVEGTVTVRARLTLPSAPEPGSPSASPMPSSSPSSSSEGQEWVLVAEAERVWDPRWPSPRPCSGPRTRTPAGTM